MPVLPATDSIDLSGDGIRECFSVADMLSAVWLVLFFGSNAANGFGALDYGRY